MVEKTSTSDNLNTLASGDQSITNTPLNQGEAKTESVSELDEPKTQTNANDRIDQKKIFKLAVLVVLIFILVGSIGYPLWWDRFLFEYGIASLNYWIEGVDLLFKNGTPIILLILASLLLLVVLNPKRKKLFNAIKVSWKTIQSELFNEIWAYLIAILIIAIGFSFLSLKSRSKYERQVEQQILNEKLYRDWRDRFTTESGDLEEKAPLTDPTSFIYLSKESIESLYGQYEPDLIPSSVIEEIKNSTDIKGEINLQSYLKTEAGKNELQRKVTEYRQSPKSIERKLKDLVRHLVEKDTVRLFRNVQTDSLEILELDGATKTLNRYNLTMDPKQLRQLRDRLLGQEVERLRTELQGLKGLVLVEGDWNVEIQTDTYIFTRSFIENVTDSPMCQIKIQKGDVSSQNRDIIEGLKTSPMRISVLGNVVTGLSSNSKIMLLSPIAIF